jgi:hypothetical protein
LCQARRFPTISHHTAINIPEIILQPQNDNFKGIIRSKMQAGFLRGFFIKKKKTGVENFPKIAYY